MRLKKTFIVFLISLIFLNISLIYATNINKNNSNNYFRIHIVANSDNIDDQILKYTIAKQVNEYVNTITANSTSKEESKKIIENNVQNILMICNNIIQEKNYSYDVKAYIGKMEYSTKYKDNIQMDPGIYDSLKIVIGNGNGENWWSLIYPTTFQDVTIEDAFDENTTYSLGLVKFFKELFSK